MIFRSTHFRPTEANGVPSEPSERRALRAIEERLLIDDEFVLQYDPDNSSDGLPPGEGLRSASAGGSSQGPMLVREWDAICIALWRSTGASSGMETYRSLSHVARANPGVRWNGPRFFGLARSIGSQEARLHERPDAHEVKG
jgi:hypothetical protein